MAKKLTLTSLINSNLKIPGETVRELAANMRALTDRDKVDLAEQFVRQGMATEVTAKNPAGEEITIAKAKAA